MYDVTESGFGKLSIKIFSGPSKVVEGRFAAFLRSEPMEIKEVLQSADPKTGDGGIVITVLYCTKNPARFVQRHFTAQEFHEDLLEYLKDSYQITFDDILDLMLRDVPEKKRKRN